MTTLARRTHIVSLAVPPIVWLAYFVLSYLVVALGCSLPASEATLRGALAVIAGASLIVIFSAGAESLKSWRSARQERNAGDRQHRTSLALLALLLCGLALLGTVWGGLNLFMLAPCQG